MAETGRASVARAIRDLEDAGLVRREPRYRADGGQTSCIYYLPVTARARPEPPSAGATPGSHRETPPSQPETPPISRRDRSPSHPETPRTSQSETKAPNTPSVGSPAVRLSGGSGERSDLGSGEQEAAPSESWLRRELERRFREHGLDADLVDVALEELRLSASATNPVQRPIRYCLRVGQRLMAERGQQREVEALKGLPRVAALVEAHELVNGGEHDAARARLEAAGIGEHIGDLVIAAGMGPAKLVELYGSELGVCQ